MLYGMAAPIARALAKKDFLYVYTPIGEILPGMGYLVRRSLEKHIKRKSFLRHTFFDKTQIQTLLRKPELKENDEG